MLIFTAGLFALPVKAEAASYQRINDTKGTTVGNYVVKNTEEGIWTKKKNGSYKRIVWDSLTSEILCNGKTIYYLTYDSYWDEAIIRKIGIDGKNDQLVYEIQKYDDDLAGLVSAYKNRIYYNAGEYGTYNYNIKTKKARKVADGMSDMIFDQNTVYYNDLASEASTNIRLIKMGLDGANKKVIDKGVFYFKIIGKKLYYVKFRGRDKNNVALESYCSCNKNGTGKKTLTKVKGLIYQFNTKYVWYERTNKAITKVYKYRKTIKTGTVKKIK
jgi:hypothetical protein